VLVEALRPVRPGTGVLGSWVRRQEELPDDGRTSLPPYRSVMEAGHRSRWLFIKCYKSKDCLWSKLNPEYIKKVNQSKPKYLP
jgi:hypothetical protein